MLCYFFFFSSRRRHTRFDCDWIRRVLFRSLLSALEFNARVLALAEDPGSPLLARLRFLTIFSTNLDQFFMVDVGSLKHQVARGIVERSPDGLTPAEQLDAIAIRLRPLVARQYR